MTDTTEKRVIPQKHQRSMQSKLLIASSLFVSTWIIVWTFSLPFRLVASAKQNDVERLQLAEQIEQKRTRNERLREEAFTAHQEFVRLIANERSAQSRKPGDSEYRKRWEKKVTRVNQQLRELGDPKPDTNEWAQKQRLLESISDAPL